MENFDEFRFHLQYSLYFELLHSKHLLPVLKAGVGALSYQHIAYAEGHVKQVLIAYKILKYGLSLRQGFQIKTHAFSRP